MELRLVFVVVVVQEVVTMPHPNVAVAAVAIFLNISLRARMLSRAAVANNRRCVGANDQLLHLSE